MTLVKHELKQGWRALAVWTGAIGFLMAICIFMFPEMKSQMADVTDLFASMGAFTAAFGMDRLNFGSFIGFYAVECGNILGLGGAFFASLTAVNALAREERDHTAEFLLAHPLGRARIVTEKLLGVAGQVIALNVIIFALSAACTLLTGETIPWREMGLLHLAYFLLQAELACICFGISAFLRRGGLGLGIGIAVMLYFCNLVANISSSAEGLKYITPFAYGEGADIVANGSLDVTLVLLGLVYAAVGVAAAYGRYCTKDIH